MALAKESARCPYCRESIAVGAIRCKHCHTDLAQPKRKKLNPFGPVNNFRTGFLCGILFSLIILVLGYYQFFAE